MTVGDLEELLARLPADMTVCIAGGGTCRHIDGVDKQPRQRRRSASVEAGLAVVAPVRNVVGDHYPPMLVLRGSHRAPPWWGASGDEVPFEVHGRWPEKAARRAR